ncbi:MAG: HD domain-containing phosphohydrolase [Candidatus Omnitrophota bacterium]|nr:HD domain-containing phosphohydrolase [Candidatus Omnitrophota bacterium]
MKESEKKEKQAFLIKFPKSSSVSAFRAFCSKILKKNRCAFLDAEYAPVKFKCRREKCNHLKLGKYLAKIKAGPLREYMIFKCSCDKICLSLPIMQGSSVYGYVLFTHLDKEPGKAIVDSVRICMDLALREFQKEQELTKLYETIRPRAIALSTIHTIHRLLSSTLNMDELIERIARLTLQVMRSRHCSIMLLDESKRYLVPKAVIDLDKEIPKTGLQYKKIKLGAKLEGGVAKTYKTVFSHNSICVPLVEEDVIGVISARDKTNGAPFDKFELEILITLAEQAVIAIKNAQMYEEQEKMAYGSIKTLAALLDSKSPNTFTHSDQFVKIVLAISEEMKLPREDIVNLHYSALLPDTGKFSIPEEIFKKPGCLSSKEYAIIKKQHIESLKIIEHMGFLKHAMPIIKHHHERYDGAGYPDGLKGAEIPVGARIMAVANAFEAMVSARPYKGKKISVSQAIKEIKKNKGSQFDPEAVDAFIEVTKKPKFKNMLGVSA